MQTSLFSNSTVNRMCLYRSSLTCGWDKLSTPWTRQKIKSIMVCLQSHRFLQVHRPVERVTNHGNKSREKQCEKNWVAVSNSKWGRHFWPGRFRVEATFDLGLDKTAGLWVLWEDKGPGRGCLCRVGRAQTVRPWRQCWPESGLLRSGLELWKTEILLLEIRTSSVYNSQYILRKLLTTGGS